MCKNGKNDENLIVVGEDDICIKKQSKKEVTQTDDRLFQGTFPQGC